MFTRQVLAGDFSAATATYSEEGDWNERKHMVGLVSNVPGRPAALDQWVAESDGHPLALMVRGDHSIRWAWEARTSRRAKDVSFEQFKSFHERLQLAEADLKQAAALDPASPIPWKSLVTTARGLSAGRDETHRRFTEMIGRYPLQSGYLSYLQHVCAKWQGSDEEMWAFADSVLQGAGPGSPLHAVYPDAILEVLIARSTIDEATKELDAERRFDQLRLAAERSVFNPSFEADTVAGIVAITTFFVAFHQFRFFSLNERLLPLLGDNPIASQPFLWGRGTHDERWARARRRYPKVFPRG